MNIYFYINIWIIILAFIFYTFQGQINNKEISLQKTNRDVTNNIYFCGIIFITLGFISGFRGGFSVDYYNYDYLFKLSGETSFYNIFFGDNDLEVGYALLNKLVFLFTSNFTIMMIVISSIIILIYLKVFREFSDILWMSMLLLVTVGSYYTSFNTIRQFLAAALTFFVSKYIYEKNWKKYFFSILLISTIHSSAIVMIPFYFLLQIKWNKVKNILIGLVSIILYAAIFVKTDIFVSFFVKNFYTGYSGQNAFGIHDGTGMIYTLRAILLFVFSLYGLTKIKLDNITQRVWFNASLYFLLFSLLATRVEMLQRLTYFFIPYVTLFVPRVISNIKSSKEKIFMIIIITVLVCAYAYLTQKNEIFYFIWEK